VYVCLYVSFCCVLTPTNFLILRRLFLWHLTPCILVKNLTQISCNVVRQSLS
jgi:hypothetical protein